MSNIAKVSRALLLAALVAASVTVAATNVDAQAARARALLVGTSDCSAGADLDVLSQVLVRAWGFSAADVKVLRLDARVTHDAAMDQLRSWLVDGTQPGDAVFVHFSGRGSQEPDKNRDEADGLDEVLVLSSRGSRVSMTDDEIHGLIQEARGRGPASLLMSFDCGFTGQERLGRLRTRALPAAKAPGFLRQCRLAEISGGPFESEDELGDMDNVAVISACRANQSAAEMETPHGSSGGVFTWALARALAETGPGDSYLDLARRTFDIACGRRQGQTPVLAGNPDALVFGGMTRKTAGTAADSLPDWKWRSLRIDLSALTGDSLAQAKKSLSARGFAIAGKDPTWDLRVVPKGKSLHVEREDGSIAGSGDAARVGNVVQREATWRYAKWLMRRAAGQPMPSLRMEPLREKRVQSDGQLDVQYQSIAWPRAYAGQALSAERDCARVIFDALRAGTSYVQLLDLQGDGVLTDLYQTPLKMTLTRSGNQLLHDKTLLPIPIRIKYGFLGVESLVVIAASEPFTVVRTGKADRPLVLKRKSDGKELSVGEYWVATTSFEVFPADWHAWNIIELAHYGNDYNSPSALIASAEIGLAMFGTSRERGEVFKPDPGPGPWLSDYSRGSDAWVLLDAAQKMSGAAGVRAASGRIESVFGGAPGSATRDGDKGPDGFRRALLGPGGYVSVELNLGAGMYVSSVPGARLHVEARDASGRVLAIEKGDGRWLFRDDGQSKSPVKVTIRNSDAVERAVMLIPK